MIKTFRIKGWLKLGRSQQRFTKEMRSISKEDVTERLYSEIGSKHGVKRNMIHISEIEEINPKEAEDPRIRALAGVD